METLFADYVNETTHTLRLKKSKRVYINLVIEKCRRCQTKLGAVYLCNDIQE